MAGAEAYKALAGRMGAADGVPVMVEPEVVRLEDQDVLVAPTLEPALPDLRTQYWTPTP